MPYMICDVLVVFLERHILSYVLLLCSHHRISILARKGAWARSLRPRAGLAKNSRDIPRPNCSFSHFVPSAKSETAISEPIRHVRNSSSSFTLEYRWLGQGRYAERACGRFFSKLWRTVTRGIRACDTTIRLQGNRATIRCLNIDIRRIQRLRDQSLSTHPACPLIYLYMLYSRHTITCNIIERSAARVVSLKIIKTTSTFLLFFFFFFYDFLSSNFNLGLIGKYDATLYIETRAIVGILSY